MKVCVFKAKAKILSSVFLTALFALVTLAFIPAISPKVRATDPLDMSVLDADENTLSMSIPKDSMNLELHATMGGAFTKDSSTVEVSTTNPTGYTLWLTLLGKDHDDDYTTSLIHKNPRVKKEIESISEPSSVADFPSNSWGIHAEPVAEDAQSSASDLFSPLSLDSVALDKTDSSSDSHQTEITTGVKADLSLPPGEYSNILGFTAITNPIPYTYTLNYDANGGTGAPSEESRIVFDETEETLTVSNVIPVRADHSSGNYIFLGWSEDKTATSADIAPGSEIVLTAEDTELGAVKTLYAVWQKNYNYALKFASGTTATVTNLPGTQTATSSGSASFTIPVSEPKRSGYAFTGYTDGSKIYDLGASVIISPSDGNTDPITKTLTATWGATDKKFSYSGSVQSYTIPVSGYYKLEVWGAQGGKSDHGTEGGRGGYSTGIYKATQGTVLYAAAGGAGGPEQGGWNGGGRGSTINSDSAAGAGASHIATASGLLSSLSGNKSAVLIVAGGGGGSGCSNTYGGGGGGASGTAAVDTHSDYGGAGGPGTQTSGGAGGQNSGSGSFGKGGDTGLSQAWPGGGGGAGWYGGGAGGNMPGGGGAGGGGSGYINPILSSAQTFSAAQNFSSPDGGHETGHSGNGYARITYLGSSL